MTLRPVHRTVVLFSFPLFLALIWTGCSGSNLGNRVNTTVQYAQVQAIFDAKCSTCHGGTDAAAGLNLANWESMIQGSDHGEAVIPFDADRSRLLRMTTQLAGGTHPQNRAASRLSTSEVELVRTWISEGATNAKGEVPYAKSKNLMYVGNQADAFISVIDRDAQVVIRTIDLQALGFAANAKPHHIAIEPDGAHWYVSLIGANKVLKFNRNNELVGQADYEAPGMLALHPTENTMYVGRSMSAVNPPQRLGVIRRDNMQIEEFDVLFPRPHGLAVHPNGEMVYTASLSANEIIEVNLETERMSNTNVPSEHEGHMHMFVQLAVSPDGKWMVSTTEHTSKLMIFSLDNPAEPNLVKTLDVDTKPWHPMFTKDGRYVYFGNLGANKVTVLDMTSQEVAHVIEGNGLAQPHGLTISPDGKWIYVTNRNENGTYTPRHDFGDNANHGTLVIIDAATNQIAKVLELGRFPSGLSFLPR